MGMTELEGAILAFPICAPAVRFPGQGREVGPTDLLLWPAQRLGERLPHRDYDGAADDRERVGCAGADEILAVILLSPGVIRQRQPDTAGGTPDVRLDRAGEHLIHRVAGADGNRIDS